MSSDTAHCFLYLVGSRFSGQNFNEFQTEFNCHAGTSCSDDIAVPFNGSTGELRTFEKILKSGETGGLLSFEQSLFTDDGRSRTDSSYVFAVG